MTEDEARGWIVEYCGLAAFHRLETLVALVIEENTRQNLVSGSSIQAIWTRHALDSVQLLRLVESEGLWLDIGTGAGFPGLAVACVRVAPMTLVEPRPLRAVFLERAIDVLSLRNVTVVHGKAGVMKSVHSVVSARAVASLDKLFAMSQGVSDLNTLFVFPRGRHARTEVADLQDHWRGVFHVEQSLSDADASIVVAQGVRRA